MTNCAPGSLALDQRIQGARQGVKAGGLEDVGVYNTNPADMASEIATVQDILRAHPDLAAMMPLCGPDTAAAGLVRKNQGRKFPIVGTVSCTRRSNDPRRPHRRDVGQQPYLQGYLPVVYAYQRVVLGAPNWNCRAAITSWRTRSSQGRTSTSSSCARPVFGDEWRCSHGATES